MEPTRHLEILRTEGERLATVPADALGAAVPTMEGWTVERVLRHTGKIHQRALAFLDAAPEPLSADAALPGMPSGPDCIPAYRQALDDLVGRFAAVDPSAPVAHFAGAATVAWWMRRQAQEVSVHRVDAQDAVHAAGGPAPDDLAADGAADGMAEWATFFLPRWSGRAGPVPADLFGRSLHLHGTDDPTPAGGAEWFITLGAEIEVHATHAKGDVALRGPAQDLLLTLWRRRPLAALDVIGDPTVAEHLLDLVRL
ncbi:MAG: maleylpyruvate isomerase N-terminal domain-containing protein [Acidimicrobiales bacterium]